MTGAYVYALGYTLTRYAVWRQTTSPGRGRASLRIANDSPFRIQCRVHVWVALGSERSPDQLAVVKRDHRGEPQVLSFGFPTLSSPRYRCRLALPANQSKVPKDTCRSQMAPVHDGLARPSRGGTEAGCPDKDITGRLGPSDVLPFAGDSLPVDPPE